MNPVFKSLNYILKKNSNPPSEEELVQPFILNRWLSMSDTSVGKVINSTTNRWITQNGICKDNNRMTHFLKYVLPKYSKKIDYIKKPKKNSLKEVSEKEDILEKALALHLSSKEIRMYDDIIEFLNKDCK